MDTMEDTRDYKKTKGTGKPSRPVTLHHPISPEALAMGDIHNGIVRMVEKILDGHESPEAKVVATIRYAAATGALTAPEERALMAIVRAWDVEAEDLGLARIRELREGLIEARAGDLAIAAAGVAVGSTEMGLQALGGGTQPQAVRRRRLWIALADLGGAIIGGIAGAGPGGAAVGSGIASSLANAVLPQND